MTLRTVACTFLILTTAALAVSVEVHPKAKSQKINVRILAAAAPIAKSGFSPNREIYVAEIVGRGRPAPIVKVVFRYLGYEDVLPETALSAEIVHAFNAVRDESCDESLQMLATKLIVNKDKTLSRVGTLRYSSYTNSQWATPDAVLPCYVTSPRDYRGVKKSTAPINDLGEN